MNRRWHRITPLVAAALAVPMLGASQGTEAQSQETPRATMHAIFEVLVDLLPRFSQESYLLPADTEAHGEGSPEAENARRAIREGLARLARASDALEVHAGQRDADFGFFSRSLATDIREAKRRADLDRFDEAHFFVTVALQNCVACHSRLPKARDFPLAERLTQRIGIDKMPAPERALYQVATRAFGAALSTWEGYFASSQFHPEHASSLAVVVEYMRIAIQVEQNPVRARETLAKLRSRLDTPKEFRQMLDSWIEDLSNFGSEQTPPSLDAARSLVGTTDAGPRPGVHIARDTLAASHLERFIDKARNSGASEDEIAEAFYLLGVVGARSADSFWRLETEFHLETAIRMAPKSDFAREAFARLTEYVHLGYSGSMGLNLPPDVALRIDELRALVYAEPAAAP